MKKPFQLLSSILVVIQFLSFSQFVFAQDGLHIFSDVDSANFNATAIQDLKIKGLIQGYSDGTFKPDAGVNRAEFLKLVMGDVAKNSTAKNCFKDVQAEWFAPYVCAAKAQGIVSGDAQTPDHFRPADTIKFVEAAKILVNANHLSADGFDKNLWYKQFVVTLGNQKDIPLSIEFFNQDVTRAETAEMVWRLQENIVDKASRTFAEIDGDGLIALNSCVELQHRYVESSHNYYYRKGVVDGMPMMEPTTGASEAAPPIDKAVSSPGHSNSSVDYSTTNLQVKGVDEADIVKNDGKYIYLIKGQSVRIIEAYPAENMKELTRLQLGRNDESFAPTEMYVDNNQLIVVGSFSEAISVPGDVTPNRLMMPQPYPYYSTKTKVYIMDITDRSKPVIVRSVEFDGNYSTSRKANGTLYLVMNHAPYFPIYYNVERTESEIKPADILPKMLDSKKQTEELIAPCAQIKILPKPDNFNFLITAAISLNDMTKEVKRSEIVGDVGNVYASASNLYVASTEWHGGYFMPQSSTENTVVYKFALGDGTMNYETNTKVPGTILNQFSMDEDGGNFRIATTSTSYGSGTEVTNNNLYILDNSLKLVGKLENIERGESLYAVRFLGNRAYLVTFKQIDPLFVIDLSNPVAPKILGKLEIPGYSNYLQPYDENHLIGFGKMVDESIDADKVHSPSAVYYTAVQGVKMGLFDVSDVSNPKQLFSEVIGARGTDSELLTNHKALLFDKDKQLLAFPITVYDVAVNTVCPEKSCQPETQPVFAGAYVYKVNLQDGFKLQAKITHLSADDQIQLQQSGYLTAYDKAIERILYIGQSLYTVSQAVVKANNLGTFQEQKLVELASEPQDLFPPPPIVY